MMILAQNWSAKSSIVSMLTATSSRSRRDRLSAMFWIGGYTNRSAIQPRTFFALMMPGANFTDVFWLFGQNVMVLIRYCTAGLLLGISRSTHGPCCKKLFLCYPYYSINKPPMSNGWINNGFLPIFKEICLRRKRLIQAHS